MAPESPTPDDYVTLNRLATVARLVSGAAHEVNNALQVISGSVELLQGRTDLHETVRKGMERIGAQAARAAAAMTGVTTLSRAQTDAREEIDLRELTARAVGLRRYAIERADIKVSVETPATSVLVVGNAAHLLQVVLNLVDNAEQALAGRKGGQIQVQVAEDGQDVIVRVRDNGPGVPREDRDRVFEPFVSSRSGGGSPGLGLPVARLIAQAHGGSLSFEPVERGAVCVLRIPRVR